jgi:hypothetical protein
MDDIDWVGSHWGTREGYTIRVAWQYRKYPWGRRVLVYHYLNGPPWDDGSPMQTYTRLFEDEISRGLLKERPRF